MPLDPTGFYARLRDNTASPLLQKYGFPCSVLVKSGEVFDPVQGIVTQAAVYGSNPTVGLYGGGMTYKYPGVKVTTDPKTLTRVRTKSALVDASLLGTVVPAPDDLFLDENGNLAEILIVAVINPGGVPIMYDLTVKL